MRSAPQCAAVYLLILMKCAFWRISHLGGFAFNGHLHVQTEERKRSVNCLLPTAPRLTAEPADGSSNQAESFAHSALVAHSSVVPHQSVKAGALSPLGSCYLCEVESGMSCKPLYQLVKC